MNAIFLLIVITSYCGQLAVADTVFVQTLRDPTLQDSTLVNRCILYLHGKRVDSTIDSNSQAVLIVRGDSIITINGHKYETLNPDNYLPLDIVRFPDKPHPDNMEDAVRRIWNCTIVLSPDEIQVEGHVVGQGDTFTFDMPDRSYQVSGTLQSQRLVIWDNDGAGCSVTAQRGRSISIGERRAKAMKLRYRHVLSYVASNHVVLLGEGYSMKYPIEMADQIASALDRLPSLIESGEINPMPPWGRFKVDRFHWPNELAGDFVAMDAR